MGKVIEQGTWTRKVAGHEHIPVLIGSGQGIQFVPCLRTKCLGKRRGRCYFYEGLSSNRELAVAIGYVKVMHPIAVFIAIGEDACSRAGMQTEVKAALKPFATWLYTHLHDTFTDGCAVAKPRHVMNDVMG